MERKLRARLMSVDPSLTCSGWALFDVRREKLLGVGKLKSLPPAISMAERLVHLQERIGECLDEVQLGKDDFLVCEAPTTMRDPRAAMLVEQVRTLFEALARERDVSVPGRINPRTVHLEVMGFKGRQRPRAEVKGTGCLIVERLYAEELSAIGFPARGAALKRHQDIVDAILVGSVAVSRLRSARAGGLSIEALFESMTSRSSRARLRAG